MICTVRQQTSANHQEFDGQACKIHRLEKKNSVVSVQRWWKSGLAVKRIKVERKGEWMTWQDYKSNRKGFL